MNFCWSASYEAVNWKIAVVLMLQMQKRSASYEAVNWKRKGNYIDEKGNRSASYEAVNWKTNHNKKIRNGLGQPRMRLWIERRRSPCQGLVHRVSLVWGCELKDDRRKERRNRVLVSLVWGCELKDLRILNTSTCLTVSLVWGCELKGNIWRLGQWLRLGQPRMRLWIESSVKGDFVVEYAWSASYEAVNWKFKEWKRNNIKNWSASYEAVNWKSPDSTLSALWVRSASYEAVNWKIIIHDPLNSSPGQPRMRLWIER